MKLNAVILALACAAPAAAFGSNQSVVSLDDQVLALIHLANTAEIADGNLADSKLADKAALAYADMLITDHTAGEQLVQNLAGSRYVDLDGLVAQLPALTALKQGHDQQVAVLQTLSGLDFERQFLADERDNHAAVLQKLEALTANLSATDPVFQLFQKLKPTIEKHESEAVQLLSQLGQ